MKRQFITVLVARFWTQLERRNFILLVEVVNCKSIRDLHRDFYLLLPPLLLLRTEVFSASKQSSEHKQASSMSAACPIVRVYLSVQFNTLNFGQNEPSSSPQSAASSSSAFGTFPKRQSRASYDVTGRLRKPTSISEMASQLAPELLLVELAVESNTKKGRSRKRKLQRAAC